MPKKEQEGALEREREERQPRKEKEEGGKEERKKKKREGREDRSLCRVVLTRRKKLSVSLVGEGCAEEKERRSGEEERR